MKKRKSSIIVGLSLSFLELPLNPSRTRRLKWLYVVGEILFLVAIRLWEGLVWRTGFCDGEGSGHILQ